MHLEYPTYGSGYLRKLLLIDDEHALESLMNHEFVKVRPDGQHHVMFLQYVFSLLLKGTEDEGNQILKPHYDEEGAMLDL